jgi:hypothetical protein
MVNRAALLLVLVSCGAGSPTSNVLHPTDRLAVAQPVCGGDSVQNQTDIKGGKVLFGIHPHVIANSSAACCGLCFGVYPAADAWVHENATGYCWCVKGVTGRKPQSSRSAGFRSTPGPTPAPAPAYKPGPLPSAAVLQACETAVTLDPPGTTRGISPYYRLAANSTADCAAACCLDWSCAAFSFNASALDCSLDNGLLPVNSTPAPTSVTSGYLAELAAPVPPFQWSTKFHHNVSFVAEMFFRTEGDSWPTTWLQDSTQLSAAGDRGDFKSPMSMFQVNGVPVSGTPQGGDAFTMQQLGGEFPVNVTQFCVKPSNTVKPTSLLSVGGEVYWGITCMNYGDEQSFKRQHNIYAWIAKATDPHGHGWNFTATPAQFFTGKLSAPMFIQYGQDYQDAVDGYVYAHFPYANDQYTKGIAQSFWNNNDGVLLGRVPKGDILYRERWEFWAGAGAGNNGTWTPDDGAAVSVMAWPQMIGMNQVNFHRPSGRYIVANYGFVDMDGLPRPWHQKPAVYRHRTQLTLFEAPQPWGPFFMFHRDDDWLSPDGAAGSYCPTFPPKWMGTTSAWMVSASCCALSTKARFLHHYNFSTQRVDFSYDESA